MDFVSNREPQLREMLQVIGVHDVDELLQDIPDALKLPKPVQDDGLSEYEGVRLMEALADKNTFLQFDSYLGAGAYEHHVPAIVEAVCSKSEFLTAYTPYQAEASQGILQSIFEFQSAICALTGMDISNASVYDGASACAEALLMTLRHKRGRRKIFVAHTLHPHYRGCVQQYLLRLDVEWITVPSRPDGRLDQDFLAEQLDDKSAAVLVQSPNFLGIVEEVKALVEKAAAVGALTVLCANPLMYGLFASAAELGVDIAVGDCQPFGNPLQFGGPYAGYIACCRELMRQIPGRIVGETRDTKGKRGFVLTLQAREQHIRREKATSNICTNQALSALASLIAMLWYGKTGIHKLALTNFQRANYLKKQLTSLPGVTALSEAPVFNEFAIRFDRPIEEIQHVFRKHYIEPGVPLGRYYPEWRDYLLVAVTETKSKEQLDRYVEVAGKGELR